MLWAPNLQLYYPFENQANDYSGNARHGTVFGSGVYATRPNAGRCLYFDGNGDYVRTPSFGLSGTVVVFACWVRVPTGARPNFFGEADYSATVGYLYIRRGDSGDDLYYAYANGTSNPYAVATNFFSTPYNDVWLHLAIVCDYPGKKTYFYRNGIPFGSPVTMSGTPVFPSTNRAKYVGSYGPTGYTLTGYLQNVQLWALATMPPAAQMLANVKRMHLGLHPIW